MKTKDLFIFSLFYDSARRDPREPSPCQSPPSESATMSPGDEYVLPFLKKKNKFGRGEGACPLQVHRKSPDLQDGFAEMM